MFELVKAIATAVKVVASGKRSEYTIRYVAPGSVVIDIEIKLRTPEGVKKAPVLVVVEET